MPTFLDGDHERDGRQQERNFRHFIKIFVKNSFFPQIQVTRDHLNCCNRFIHTLVFFFTKCKSLMDRGHSRFAIFPTDRVIERNSIALGKREGGVVATLLVRRGAQLKTQLHWSTDRRRMIEPATSTRAT